MNVLYKGLESLNVLEQLDDNQFDFIYLDVPLFTAYNNKFSFSDDQDIEFKRYSDNIAKVIENTSRLLKADGILAFLAPLHDYTKINFKIILDQFYPESTSYTIQNKRSTFMLRDSSKNTNSTLYFCSKIDDFKFPVLKELPPKDKYNQKDQRGCFMKDTAFRLGDNIQYEWHGITPPDNRSWRYSKEKMDELYNDDRVVIDNGKVYLKQYREEHLVPISPTWDYTDNTKLRMRGFSIDSKSIDRMFEMFTSSDSHVLCPYDRDGKFSWMADNAGLVWTSVCPLGFPAKQELFRDIPEDHYMTINELQDHKSRIYQDRIVTGVKDIADLKAMASKVNEIQTLVGVSSPDEAIGEIHKLIENQFSESAIAQYLLESQEWLKPYWDKLEANSQRFIPMGMLLYDQFIDIPDADMAPIMIEYSRSLEEELLKKLFYGYVYDLKTRGVIVKKLFPEAFDNYETKHFAKFLQGCLSWNKDKPDEWQFLMGEMVRVLNLALEDNPRDNLIIDFRNYLDKIFEKKFFSQDFCLQLNRVREIRNLCAHPNNVDSEKVKDGKEMVRGELLLLLENYKN